MSYDYYAEAERIACELVLQSHVITAELIRRDISEGSTATEILMALRHDLNPAASDLSVALSTRSRVKQLLEHINRALAP